MIAVTGSAGKTGQALLGALASLGHRTRALVARRDQAASVSAAGAGEVAVGNLTDPESLAQGLRGCTSLYHICPNLRPDEEAIGERVVAACRRAGVGRLVYHSVLHPQIEAMPHHWRKLRVEGQIIESGLDFAILQPCAYMQNLRSQWRSVVRNGVLEVPFAQATRIGMVDLRDVAGAAARVLTEAGHEGATYELCGTEWLDQREVAAAMAAVAARPVRIEVVRREDWAERALAAGQAASAVEELVAMFQHYEAHGFRGGSRALQDLLGRPPARFAEVVRRWTSPSGS